jgi:hypothetical protein
VALHPGEGRRETDIEIKGSAAAVLAYAEGRRGPPSRNEGSAEPEFLL